MSTLQKAGSNLDNQMANAVEEATDDSITAHSMRGSGNTKHPQLDVLIRKPLMEKDAFIELKRSSIDRGDRTTIFDTDDTFQIGECYNGNTDVYVGVKFTNCQMFVGKVDMENVIGRDNGYYVQTAIADTFPLAFDANVTGSSNVSVRKPSLDDWPSASAGKDEVDVVLEAVGLNQ